MKRMDAGGYAACFNHEQLALMCANSDRTIDRLGAENKQLKTENKELREQNTELRELVRAMYYCNLPWKDCDKCAMNGADMHVEIDEMEFCDGMNDRLRELGVVK